MFVRYINYIDRDSKDWFVFAQSATWRTTVGARQVSPHKVDIASIPFLSTPGMSTATICTDPLHTFHLGWGKDLGSGGIVLLAKLQYFGRGALDARLERAYEDFLHHCVETGKTTSCDMFSKKDFDMQ